MPNSATPKANRDQWASRIGVILAVAGSAVGLGNFLRFPGQAAQNGGGAFMLPYFISLLVLGIPLCWAEWTMGRYGGRFGFNSAPGIFSTIWRSRLAKYFGAVALLIPLVIYMYYVVIEAWCLGYAINYLTGDMMTSGGGAVEQLMTSIKEESATPLTEPQAAKQAFSAYFVNFIGAEKDGAVIHSGGRLLVILAGVFFLNFVLIYRGVSKGIETFCKIAMPVMMLLGIVVLVRVLTLGTPNSEKPDQNIVNGLGAMWNPSLSALLDAKTWLAASGQIFFSLSVGFGIIINYASYLRSRSDVALSGLTASSMNEFFEVCLGGLITIPAAFMFLGPLSDEALGSSFSLGFKTLPNVFNAMWGGRFFGFLWFFMLFVAAITSSVSMLQPVIAFFEEGLGLKRHASVAMLGLVSALGCGFVLYFSAGTVALDTFDFWVGTFLIFVLAMFQAILYGWIFGIKRGHDELHRGAHIRVPKIVQYMLKFVVPVYLIVIFAMFCVQALPSSESPAFVAEEMSVEPLRQGTIEPALTNLFQESKLALPESAKLTSAAENGPWTVEDSSGKPVYVIRLAGGKSESGRLQINKYVLGTVEQIMHSTVALSSMCFIGTVLLFLLLLIHIAGRRWETEGRFKQLTPLDL